MSREDLERKLTARIGEATQAFLSDLKNYEASECRSLVSELEEYKQKCARTLLDLMSKNREIADIKLFEAAERRAVASELEDLKTKYRIVALDLEVKNKENEKLREKVKMFESQSQNGNDALLEATIRAQLPRPPNYVSSIMSVLSINGDIDKQSAAQVDNLFRSQKHMPPPTRSKPLREVEHGQTSPKKVTALESINIVRGGLIKPNVSYAREELLMLHDVPQSMLRPPLPAGELEDLYLKEPRKHLFYGAGGPHGLFIALKGKDLIDQDALKKAEVQNAAHCNGISYQLAALGVPVRRPSPL
jgi:hypothetical protein